MITFVNISCIFVSFFFVIALGWMSTSVQVIWCHQATSHYLSQCWPTSMSPYGVTMSWPLFWIYFKDLFLPFSQYHACSSDVRRRILFGVLWHFVHNDVTWKDFSHYSAFMQGIHQLLVDSPHKEPVMWNYVFFAVSLKLLYKITTDWRLDAHVHNSVLWIKL